MAPLIKTRVNQPQLYNHWYVDLFQLNVLQQCLILRNSSGSWYFSGCHLAPLHPCIPKPLLMPPCSWLVGLPAGWYVLPYCRSCTRTVRWRPRGLQQVSECPRSKSDWAYLGFLEKNMEWTQSAVDLKGIHLFETAFGGCNGSENIQLQDQNILL